MAAAAIQGEALGELRVRISLARAGCGSLGSPIWFGRLS
jgi:hypothetical protein